MDVHPSYPLGPVANLCGVFGGTTRTWPAWASSTSADGEGGRTAADDERLGVRMMVQPRSGAGLLVDSRMIEILAPPGSSW